MKKTNILALSFVMAASLQAAPSNIGDALREVKPPKIKQEKKELPTIETQKIEPIKEFDKSKKIAIKEITVLGVVHVEYEDIKKILSLYENRDLSFSDIQDLASEITKYYRVKGYFVTRAYVPNQNILEQNNNLTIKVIEGNYGKFELQNSSLVKDSVLQANLDNIKDTKIVSINTLGHALLIINDTPGAVVTKAEVRPGKEVGTSDFIVGVDATKRYSGFILGDNYGSQYTGRHRLIVGADINSPLEVGDKLSFMGLTSEDAGLLNARVAYDFPAHANGLRANLSYSKTTYELGSTYKDLDAVGTSDSFALRVTYPLIKTREQSLKLYADTSYNSMKEEIKISSINVKKDSFVATIGANYSNDTTFFGKDAQSRAELSYSFGTLNFKNNADKELDKAGANTEGRFSKINITLGQDFDFNDKIKWENSLQMQYALADKNLDSSQDMSIGGIYGVRYYPDAEESAENGYIFNTELFYTLPEFKNINSKVSIFYDIGRTYMSKNIYAEKTRTLQDAGIGYVSIYKSMYLNTHLARNISKSVESERSYNVKFLLQAGLIF